MTNFFIEDIAEKNFDVFLTVHHVVLLLYDCIGPSRKRRECDNGGRSGASQQGQARRPNLPTGQGQRWTRRRPGYIPAGLPPYPQI